MSKTFLDLRLFDAGAGGNGTGSGSEGAGAAGQQTGEAKVVYGKQAGTASAEGAFDAGEQKTVSEETSHPTTSSTKAERQAAFEQLINGEYKDLFGERVQTIIDKRFAKTKGLEEQAARTESLLQMLGDKYGVDGTDAEALKKAISEDRGFWEEAAAREGLSVKQYQEMRELRRQAKEAQQLKAAAEQQRQGQERYADWMRQAEAMKAKYPAFDFRAELSDAQFQRLLSAGVSVEAAYTTLHMDELMQNAMQVTANAVSKQTADQIRARGSRPSEAGQSSQSGVIVKSDVTKLTAKDRRAAIERARMGERVEF